MKKVLFIAVLAVASLASCKKDRTCVCTTTVTGSGYPTTTTTSETTIKDTKKKATEACDKLDQTYSTFGLNYDVACSLK